MGEGPGDYTLSERKSGSVMSKAMSKVGKEEGAKDRDGSKTLLKIFLLNSVNFKGQLQDPLIYFDILE